MKKTVFSKIFLNNVIIILSSMLILAVSSFIIITHVEYNARIETLKDNAKAITRFIDSGIPAEQLENLLYGFSHSANKNIIIINKDCRIIMESTVDGSYTGEKRIVDKKFCREVLSGKDNVEKGTLGGIYSSDMYTLQLPIAEQRMGRIVGAIFISMPAPELLELQGKLFGTMSIAFLAVLLMSFLLSYALSKRISKPIKKMGIAVRKFAKGDFSSRVDLDKGNSITEIEELEAAFNDMAFHLEKAEDIRNNFISDVSHELRTPMTTIGGFVDGILDGTVPAESREEYLKIVKDEISRLSSLVNSFLDVTRNAENKQELQTTVFDVNETIRRTLFNFESRICENDIEVDVVFETEACYVRADSDSITRVLTNLIENAIKFTNNGGILRISTETHQQEVFVSVYNTGCGISSEDRKLIFERFYKVDKSRSLNRDGTGIGLYIVKDIINRHGKNIIVKSVEGEYAEFVFTLDKGKI